MGLNKTDVTLTNSTTPLHVVKMEGEENMVAVELESNMTFFWRVDSTREGFLYTGDTWTFSTK